MTSEDARKNPSSCKGVIWKIDRNAIHDGPGIRTTLYFKGCPLRCRWCSNPEGQSADPFLIFQQSRCDDCQSCIEACPAQALNRQGPAKIHIRRSRCNECGACLPICPTEALQVWGRSYTVDEVLRILEKDRVIHHRSGGGVTCTGGEPFDQGDFLLALLKECRSRGIHAAVETSAYADEEPVRELVESIDWLFIDIKHMDPQRLLDLAGRSNDIILNNVRVASRVMKDRGKALVIRQVVVPGMTDGRNMADLADFVATLPFVTGVELLAYHSYGAYKYDLLGIPYGLKGLKPPTKEEMEGHKALLRGKGLKVM